MPRLFCSFVLALLLLAAGTGGCDRFADEERAVDVRVIDGNGNALRFAEVHAVLHFSPSLDLQASPAVPYVTSGQTAITVEVLRQADGALMLRTALGILGPGPHAFEVHDLPIPNGVYTLRVRTGGQVLAEAPFFLNHMPQRGEQRVPYGRTGTDGRLMLSYDALSLGTSALLGGEGEDPVPRTVADSLTVIAIPPGGAPHIQRVRVRPVGTTRVTVTVE